MATTLIEEPLDVAMTSDGDVYVGPEGLKLVSGIQGVVQLCTILLRLTTGEWFLNIDKGIDWFEYLGGKLDQLAGLQSELTTKILTVPNVVEVLSMSVVVVNRRVSILWDVRTAFGNTGPQTTTL